jgi:hypothetical protein
MSQREMSQTKTEELESMTPALRRECSAIRKLLARAAEDEVGARYEAGVLIAKIEDRRDAYYGESAVACVARALGQKPRTLYRYATVARTWPRKEMAALGRRRNCHGLPLVWSHWVELAGEKEWKAWLELTLTKGWRAKRLGRELESARDKAPAADGDAEESTREAILEGSRNVARLNSQVASLRQLLERLLRDPDRGPDVEEPLVELRALISESARRTAELEMRFKDLPPPKGPPPAGARNGARRPGAMLLSGATPGLS